MGLCFPKHTVSKPKTFTITLITAGNKSDCCFFCCNRSCKTCTPKPIKTGSASAPNAAAGVAGSATEHGQDTSALHTMAWQIGLAPGDSAADLSLDSGGANATSSALVLVRFRSATQIAVYADVDECVDTKVGGGEFQESCWLLC